MRRWQVLLIGGLIGVASLLLVPFEVLARGPVAPASLRPLAIINPAILTVIAVFIGEITARRVGLRAPLVDAWVGSAAPGNVFRKQLPSALIVGVVVAAILVGYGMTVGAQLVAGAGSQERLAAFDLPLAPKLLYGGITEELLTRWALVSTFAWIGWKLSGRPERLPVGVIAFAVSAAALIFAAGHLPLLFLIAPNATAGTIAVVMVANTVPGVLFGTLFVRNGLEAVMMAHALAHLLATASLGAFA
jgi:hypothetical protein